MLPLQFLQKMPKYNLELDGGDTVEVTLVEHEAQLDSCVAEIRSRLGRLPMVGIDLKTDHSNWSPYEILVLYVEDRCYLIKFDDMPHFPTSLGELFEDNSICFVGMRLKNNPISWSIDQKPFFFSCEKILTTGVDIRQFAARVMKNSSLAQCESLLSLARSLGFSDLKELRLQQEQVFLDFCFSDQEMKIVINQAYICFKLGANLRSKLEVEDSAASSGKVDSKSSSNSPDGSVRRQTYKVVGPTKGFLKAGI